MWERYFFGSLYPFIVTMYCCQPQERHEVLKKTNCLRSYQICPSLILFYSWGIQMEATCLMYLNLQIWFHLQVQHFDTCNLAYNERFMPQSNAFWGHRQKANLQLFVLSCTSNSLKGVRMEKAFLIFSDISNYRKLKPFQKRKKNPKDLDVGLCSQIPASCSLPVSPHTTRKRTGWTDTSKSFLIPHFRSLEINFIINLEAWFNCANYIFSWELMDYYLPSSRCT